MDLDVSCYLSVPACVAFVVLQLDQTCYELSDFYMMSDEILIGTLDN